MEAHCGGAVEAVLEAIDRQDRARLLDQAARLRRRLADFDCDQDGLGAKRVDALDAVTTALQSRLVGGGGAGPRIAAVRPLLIHLITPQSRRP